MTKAMTAMLGYLTALACVASTAGAVAAEGGKLRIPAGYFALQPGDPAVLQPGNRRVISAEQLALPHVAGLTIRARWKWLQPEKGKIDLSFLEEQVKRCHEAGKPYKLLVMTGAGCAPEWIRGAWYRGAPVPWSPELAASYGELVKALGEKFADDPLLVGVHITGPTFPSAEMHPAPGIVQVAGYSDRAMIDAWSRSIADYAAAFPDTACILSISVRPPANRYLGQVVAAGKKALGARFTLEHNALKASTQPMAPHHLFIAREAKAGTRVGFEMVSAAANSAPRFGSKDVMDGIAVGKAAGGTYFDVYPPDLANLR
ncbi:hypothetical protein [Lacipirellula sp.]|uniref:hypothetical protein n=1 Tax=Lacipirellula sp. TaxID=2691419 RepID=UPI003D13B309